MEGIILLTIIVIASLFLLIGSQDTVHRQTYRVTKLES